MTSIEVVEVYRTIQGESTYAGMPCVIVRLAGCNLHCTYCDSAYATVGSHMSIKDVIHSVNELQTPLVEVTGGEPLLQEGTPQLLSALLGRRS